MTERAEEAPGFPEIVRIVAPNPGPMTLAGTNTYLVGRDPAYVVDPGPDAPAHIDAIRAAAAARGGIGGVILTHSHHDHSAGAAALGEPLLWGVVGQGDEAGILAAAAASLASAAVPPARPAAVEPAVEIGPLTVVPTPGHAADHVVVDAGGGAVLCGDLILGEGSSIVPPLAGGGSLPDYLGSLDRLAALGAGLLCPGHGPWITDPAAKIAAYRSHRLDRERRLVAALDGGIRSRERLLELIWDDVPAELRIAAGFAMQAHLEKLAGEGRLPAGALSA